MENFPTLWQQIEEENRWLLKRRKLLMKNFLTEGKFWEENQRLMTERWKGQEVEVLTETVG